MRKLKTGPPPPLPNPGRHGQLRAISAKGDDRGAVADAIIGLSEVRQVARKGERLARVAEQRDQLVGRNVQAAVVAHRRRLSRCQVFPSLYGVVIRWADTSRLRTHSQKSAVAARAMADTVCIDIGNRTGWRRHTAPPNPTLSIRLSFWLEYLWMTVIFRFSAAAFLVHLKPAAHR